MRLRRKSDDGKRTRRKKRMQVNGNPNRKQARVAAAAAVACGNASARGHSVLGQKVLLRLIKGEQLSPHHRRPLR